MDQLQLLGHVRIAAEAIVDRLGSDAGLNVEVEDVGFYTSQDMPGTNELILELRSGNADTGESLSHVRVTLRESSSGNSAGYALYPLGVPEPEAIVTLASHIQDYVTESVGGQPIPACPGHKHPMIAEVVDLVPVWRCPHGADNYTERIIAAPSP